jgi:hypothetical protein
VSYTKYVMFENGMFLLISKYTGVEHSTLAQFGPGCPKVKTAGFLWPREDGTLQSYGKSLSLGKDSCEEDGILITQALQAGRISTVRHDPCGFYFATSDVKATHLFDEDSVEPTTLDSLKTHRIIEDE